MIHQSKTIYPIVAFGVEIARVAVWVEDVDLIVPNFLLLQITVKNSFLFYRKGGIPGQKFRLSFSKFF